VRRSARTGTSIDSGFVGVIRAAPLKENAVRRRDGRYECARCGVMLDVPDHAQVRTMIMQSSGEPAVRAILVDGKEIHRCERDRTQA